MHIPEEMAYEVAAGIPEVSQFHEPNRAKESLKPKD